MESAIKLEDGEHLAADAHGNGPAGDHFVSDRRFNAGTCGHGGEVSDPDGAAILPSTARQVSPARKGKSHALLNEGFGVAAGCAPRRAEFKALFVGVDDPFDGHVPSLGDADGLEDAHGGGFG